ncbi:MULTISPECIES: hypothetical protein [unclassified Saccharothrix]|uniref:hypothetical protein n=1 Tax=unclassified Saccharothrix TaxID=2593673 RepID=UPI00307D6196
MNGNVSRLEHTAALLTSIEEFHSRYMAASSGQRHSVEVLGAVSQTRLLPWPAYRAHVCVQDQAERRRLFELHQVMARAMTRFPQSTGGGRGGRDTDRAVRVLPDEPIPPPGTAGSAADDPVRPRPPADATPDSALQARTVPEFMALLRLIAANSGLNRNQLAGEARIPTSSAYRLLDEANTVLPTKGERVRALCAAAGLTEHQVDRVWRLWRELRAADQKAGGQAAKAPLAPVDDPAVGGVEPVVDAEPDDEDTVRLPRADLERPRPRRRRWLAGALIVLAVVLGLALGAWIVLGTITEDRPTSSPATASAIAATGGFLLASVISIRQQRRVSATVDAIRRT